jgi:hypothetical protein
VNSRANPAAYGFVNIPGLPNGQPGQYGGRKITSVAYPGNKVYMYEQFARHMNKVGWWSYVGFETAKPVVQFFDNSASIKHLINAQNGCNPNNGSEAGIPYTPAAGSPDPSPPPGMATPLYKHYLAYTKGGLQGVDFGGERLRSHVPY